MDRARRVWHRGWLRRAVTVFSFGYFPVADGIDYIVTADAECRLVGLMDSAVRFVADAGTGLHNAMASDAEVCGAVATDGVIRLNTDMVDVGL